MGSDIDVINRALYELRRDRNQSPDAFAFSLEVDYRLRADIHPQWRNLSLKTPQLTLLGYPVEIDPQLPKDEIHLRLGDKTVKIVNLG